MKYISHFAFAMTVSATSSYAATLPDLELFRALPADGSSSTSFFGGNVAIQQNMAVFSQREAAYVFDINTGKQISKLSPSDGAPRDFFGDSVAISGDLVVVGSGLHDATGTNSGAVYVFNARTGKELRKIVPSDLQPFDQFGRNSVDISGTTAIIGADEVAYVFDASTGQQLAKLAAPAEDAYSYHFFGHSVALGEGKAVVGARGDNENGTFSGAAYVFDIATGVQLAKLQAEDADTLDLFGIDVAISGNTAIIGANDKRTDDSGVAYTAATAYLFDTTTGEQIAKLEGGDHFRDNEHSISVDIFGDYALVGSMNAASLDHPNAGLGFGSVLVFDSTDGSFITELSDWDAGLIGFGSGVGISSSGIAVGAPLASSDGKYLAGSGYIYKFENIAPVPLPTGSWLMLSGLGLLVGRRKLRKG